jgi:hypothetical protein
MAKPIYGTRSRKSTPAVLLVFDRGLNASPIVIPNGGDEETDSRLIEWIQDRLLSATNQERTAA